MGSSIKSMFGRNSMTVKSNSSSLRLSFSKPQACVWLRNACPLFVSCPGAHGTTCGEPMALPTARCCSDDQALWSRDGHPSSDYSKAAQGCVRPILADEVDTAETTCLAPSPAGLHLYFCCSALTQTDGENDLPGNPALLWQSVLPTWKFWKLASGVE